MAIGISATLFLYCMGHGLLTQTPFDPVLSMRWSISHASGVVAIFAGSQKSYFSSVFSSFCLALFAALMTSSLIFILSATLFGPPYVLHNYLSVGLWFGLCALLTLLLIQPKSRQTLVVDFGQSRQIIPVEQVIAAHGARNYLELEISDHKASAIARITMQAFLRAYPDLFLQTHRSHLVNPRHIRTIEQGLRGSLKLSLSNGNTVPVSAVYAKAILNTCQHVPPCDISSQPARQE